MPTSTSEQTAEFRTQRGELTLDEFASRTRYSFDESICNESRGRRLKSGTRWHLPAKTEKGRLHRRPERLILKAGHGIRTRDFDLGKVALYH